MAVVQARDGKQQERPPEKRVDETLMRPGKYEVTPETTFKISLFLKEKEGRWLLMVGPGKDVDKHEVVFRMWGYDEMVDIRKASTNYDPTKRIHVIDQDAMNRHKVQRLLVSWTFDRDNPRLRLFHVNGVLVDESWKAFTKLQPNILNHILEKMNEVYELNG